MNVPQLRFSGFDGEWEHTFLGEVLIKIQDGNYGGKYPTNEEFLESGIPFLTGKVLGKTGRIDEKKIDYISMKKHKELKKAHIQKNDILFTNRGASVGAIGFNDGLILDGNIGPQLTLIRADTEKLLSKLLYQIIKAPTVQKQILESDSGSAMKFFGIESTKKFIIDFPVEIKEQKRIVAFFDLLDKKIEKQLEKIEKLEQFKKGMMQKIFSQELRFKDVDGKEFLEWEEKLLSQISVINPKTDPLQVQFYYIDLESVDKGGVGDLKTVNIDGAPSRAQRVLMKNDVLFQTVRPYQQNHFYVEEQSDKQLVASTGFAQIRTNQSSRYIYYLMHTEEFSQEVLNRCTGTSYPAINSSHLGKIKVPVPSLAEQTKIADFLFALDNKLTKEKEKLMVLEEQKRGFMWGMFV